MSDSQPTGNQETEPLREAHDDGTSRTGQGSDHAVQLVASLVAAGAAVPATLADIAFSDAPTVMVRSAEGVVTYAGADADPGERGWKFIKAELDQLGHRHEAVNQPLAQLRRQK